MAIEEANIQRRQGSNLASLIANLIERQAGFKNDPAENYVEVGDISNTPRNSGSMIFKNSDSRIHTFWESKKIQDYVSSFVSNALSGIGSNVEFSFRNVPSSNNPLDPTERDFDLATASGWYGNQTQGATYINQAESSSAIIVVYQITAGSVTKTIQEWIPLDTSKKYVFKRVKDGLSPFGAWEKYDFGGGAGYLVKSSVNDTTAGYLLDKLAIDPTATGITFDLLNPSGDEQVALGINVSDDIDNILGRDLFGRLKVLAQSLQDVCDVGYVTDKFKILASGDIHRLEIGANAFLEFDTNQQIFRLVDDSDVEIARFGVGITQLNSANILLQNVPSGTIDVGNWIGLDTNGKVVKQANAGGGGQSSSEWQLSRKISTAPASPYSVGQAFGGLTDGSNGGMVRAIKCLGSYNNLRAVVQGHQDGYNTTKDVVVQVEESSSPNTGFATIGTTGNVSVYRDGGSIADITITGLNTQNKYYRIKVIDSTGVASGDVINAQFRFY